MPLCHQDDFVEVLDGCGGRLVNGGDDCFPFGPGKVVQDLHYSEGFEAVQARGRLIEDDQSWVSYEFDTDRSSLPLTTRDGLVQRGADLSIFALLKTELVNDPLHSNLLYALCRSQLKLRSKH